MRILTISTDRKIFEAGSAVSVRQIRYGELFERLEIIIFAKKGLGLETKKLSPNVTAYPTNSLSRLLYFIDGFRLAKKLDKPDLVSAQDPFESGIAAFLISLYWRVPMHLQVHTDFLSAYFSNESFLNKVRVLIAKYLIKRASSLRVVTERIKRSIIGAGLIDESKITVLPIFVDTEKISNSVIKTDLHKKYPQFKRIILMASRITPEKGIDMAISAMAEVVKLHPNFGLVIVGDGPEGDRLKAQCEKLKINSNVVFEGWSNDLASYYKSSDLFLLTSKYEGYGMTVAEALSAGRSVIMSDVGVAGELLIHEKNGLIFPVGDQRALTETLLLYFRDTELRLSIEFEASKISTHITEEDYLKKYGESLG
jgi:glycosyltransferase involved in cell wall biosynthesis